MRVLLSIKPEFAEKILNGEKRYEFRKILHSDRSVRTAYIYATNPVKMIVGEFEIIEIISDSAENIWNMTSEEAGIDRDRYNKYFEKSKVASAIRIGLVKKYANPVSPELVVENFTPPQSFMYVPKKSSRDVKDDFRQMKLI